MSNERMVILKMLEEGKITAESASKLLSALSDEGAKTEPGNTAEREFGSQRRRPEGSGGSPGWVSDLGKKIEVVAKDLEPKVQKIAGVVIEKSVEIADAATKSIQNARERSAEKETRARTASASRAGEAVYGAGAGQGASKAMSGKSFELSVSPDLPNEIILKSPKGSINIKGYNGDKATVNITFGKTSAAKEIEFLKLGCVYQLNYDADCYESINVDAFIPSGMFKRITVETEASDVSLDNIDAGKMEINTSKCHVSVKNVKAEMLKIDNIDGAVILSNLEGIELLVENANGTIDASNADFSSMKLETTAEPVSIISQGFYKHRSYNWVVRTSNARLKASLPVSSDLGYDIKAYTSLSDVSNGLSGISYTRNDRNCIEGKTEGFEAKPKKARIELDTSNAPLYIN